jgi:hypothetical protein
MPLKLSAELAVDLHAFCEIHYDTPQSHVICAALRTFIDSELAANPVTKARFEAVRKRLETSGERKVRPGEALRLVESQTRNSEPSGPGK